MRHEKEPPSDGQGRNENKGSAWERISPVGFNPPISLSGELFPFGGEGQKNKLRETRLALRQQDRRENGVGHPSPKENGQKPDGFEFFVDPQDPLQPPQQEEILFVNRYNGGFATRMKLNREGVEEVLRIAHLDGQVVLSSFVQSRQQSEVQRNELAAKRFGAFDRRTQKTEEENPYKRVVSTPEGWRIEINDQGITEELTERKLSGEKLQRAFINRFNGQLRKGLMECVWREKFSSEKDKAFKAKFFLDLIYLGMPASLLRLGINEFTIPFSIGGPFLMYGANRFISRLSYNRDLNYPWDYFLPFVQIDKVGRAFLYLMPVIGKGRTLVREIREEK